MPHQRENDSQVVPPPVGAVPGADPWRVLVVDDTEDIRALLRVVFRRSAFPMTVDEAASGKEALEKVEATPPHIMILDIMMPGMDGYEVCRRIRAREETARLPVIMLTAREDTESRNQGFLAGADDYLVKPCNPRELLERTRKLIERTYVTPHS